MNRGCQIRSYWFVVPYPENWTGIQVYRGISRIAVYPESKSLWRSHLKWWRLCCDFVGTKWRNSDVLGGENFEGRQETTITPLRQSPLLIFQLQAGYDRIINSLMKAKNVSCRKVGLWVVFHMYHQYRHMKLPGIMLYHPVIDWNDLECCVISKQQWARMWLYWRFSMPISVS